MGLNTQKYVRCFDADTTGQGETPSEAYSQYLAKGGNVHPNGCNYEEVVPLIINIVWLKQPIEG